MKYLLACVLMMGAMGCSSKCEKLKDSEWGKSMGMVGSGRSALQRVVQQCEDGELSDREIECLLNSTYNDSANCQ